jgi:hypothetical protein
MTIIIKKVDNGYIITEKTQHDKACSVIEEAEMETHGELNAAMGVLYCVRDLLGFSGSAYDGKQICIFAMPGYKFDGEIDEDIKKDMTHMKNRIESLLEADERVRHGS